MKNGSVVGALIFGWATDLLYRSRHHAWIAMGTKAAAAVVVGFVVNFLTMILAPGQWLPLVLYVPLVAWWWWRHGQRRYFNGTWEAQMNLQSLRQRWNRRLLVEFLAN